MEYMQDNRDILLRLEQNSRQQVKLARFQCILSVLCFVCCGAVLVMVFSLVPQLEALVTQAENFVSQAEDMMDELNTVAEQLAQLDVTGLLEDMDGLLTNVDSLISNVDALVSSSQEGVEQTMAKLNQIDFQKLNKAIEDLAAVVEPLAKFFKTF